MKYKFHVCSVLGVIFLFYSSSALSYGSLIKFTISAVKESKNIPITSLKHVSKITKEEAKLIDDAIKFDKPKIVNKNGIPITASGKEWVPPELLYQQHLKKILTNAIMKVPDRKNMPLEELNKNLKKEIMKQLKSSSTSNVKYKFNPITGTLNLKYTKDGNILETGDINIWPIVAVIGAGIAKLYDDE